MKEGRGKYPPQAGNHGWRRPGPLVLATGAAFPTVVRGAYHDKMTVDCLDGKAVATFR